MAVKTAVAFKGTAEQEQQLREVIKEHRTQKGALMPILQKAQDLYGYLPIEVQKIVAQELGISMSEVYGVATFYSQFTLNPKGENMICVCMGTACYVKGAQAILDRLEAELGISSGSITADGKFSIDANRCVGACGLAPVMTINDDVYGQVLEADIPKILSKYQHPETNNK